MPARRFAVSIVLLCVFCLAVYAQPSAGGDGAGEVFDILIRGGRVLDGTGNPWFYADIGIRDGRIATVGALGKANAARIIEARGLYILPGFIDLHSHADNGLDSDDPRRRAAPNLVSQGITTVVINPDGRSPWPIGEQRAALTKSGIGPNAILMVGHNTIRRRALGQNFQRLATPEEIEAMRAMVRQGMQEGAWGLSAGLEYTPAIWSNTDEVVALVEQVKPYRGVYLQHERSSGVAPMWWVPSMDAPGPPTVLDSLRETIAIAERTGVTSVATHIKARGVHYWGASGALVQMIERARARGVPIWADQYPYPTSGSDGRIVLIPDWVIGSRRGSPRSTTYADLLRGALDDPEAAARLRRDVAHEIEFRGGAENIVVFDYPDAAFIGKSLAELAAARRITPVDMVFALQMEGYADRPGGARLRSFSMQEPDLEVFAAQPWMATASDAGIALPEDGPAVHARYYGTFPRKIRHYAIERGVLSVADAVRSATSLPAQILGLRDRGMVREGFHADLVVVDLTRLRDRATFTDPHQHAAGVLHVLVGGHAVVDDGTLTGALPGAVLSLLNP